MHITKNLLSLAAVSLLAQGASASYITGQPIVVPRDGDVTVIFRSQDAGARGSLYFLGTQDTYEKNYVASTDHRGLGRFLFENKGTPAGFSLLLGSFHAGDILHFAYRISNGSGHARTGDTFRTDVSADIRYFGQQAGPVTPSSLTTTVLLEDIKNVSKSDWDYNDLVFDVRTSFIPTPGPIALAACGIALAAIRRRQK